MNNIVISDKEKFYIDLIHKAYEEGLSVEEKCNELGVSSWMAGNIKRKFKIKTKRFNVPNKRIDKDIEKEMVEMYLSGKTSGYISKHFGYKTRKTVLDVLSKYDIKKKKGLADYTNYNKDVFKKINSHDKAYILGFIYADGYVYKNYEGLGIQITEDDGYLLDRMKPFFGESTTIIKIDCKKKRANFRYKCRDMKRLGVFCPKIAKDLQKLGVIKNKTYELSMPEKCVPKKYLYSFARGFFDGDGTLGMGKKGYLYCRAVAKSEVFAFQFQALFPDQLSCQKRHGLWYLEVKGGQKAIVSFLEKMYKHKNDLYLERKYDRIKDKIYQAIR